MVERSSAEAARAMNGAVIAGDPQTRWSGGAIDSRQVAGREIFFALPGEQVDGHDFVPQAVARGAAAVVVHRDLELPAHADAGGAKHTARVKVKDTYQALHDLTRAIRRQVPRRLVGITGSAGKTTTKELLAAMLARRFRTARSPGNLNNTYGFPLALLGIRDDCQWMVAEMGMSTPGELRQVSLLGRPDVAVFTNVRPAHLENFANLRAIADAKAELLAGLAGGGLVVANAGDPEVMRIVERHRAESHQAGTRYVLYGMAAGDATGGPVPDVTATTPLPLGDGRSSLALRPGYCFELTAGGNSVEVELPLHGLYNVENFLAAAACAHALGVSLADVAAAVADFEPGSMRGVVHRRGKLTVIDDSYNSNPDAAAQALESARQLPADRHVAILGDMLELGPRTPEFHLRLGERAAELGFALVVGVGERARQIVATAGQQGAETHWFPTAAEAAEWAGLARVGGDLLAGDLVLVKGSRGVGLEVVATALCNEEESA